ncbi:alpha/beta fold hydrolase [Natrononativus amylolyticus]|uniref:alpha/beta fold hydrolase n=1 Tax=Natrononativus amylolyticus TaxID=2963434 RepID=UPI0020CF11FF|nr:alpha/beta hydrolase [Natrononativus amylolyticus]
METVVNLGRDIAYDHADRGGDAAGLCCIHGSGGSRTVWKSQRRLADSRPVTALDLSGHGASEDIEAEPGYTTLSAYADDVLAVVAETESRVLVGNSLGGAIVLHILLEREFEPDAAVLAGSGARLGVLQDLLEWLETDFERAIEFLHGEDRFFHDPDPRLRELSIEAMRECDRAVTSRDFHTCHEFDVRDRLGEIDVPVLAVCGEYDQLTPPRFHEYLATEIDDAALYEIEDAAHLAMLEQPEAFNHAVAAFLDAHDL